MASKQCPQCDFWQEENAERCKCGYQFPPGETGATSLPAAPVIQPRPETRTAWNWYIWLWISPLFTVPTYFILRGFQGDRSLSNALFYSLLATLGSALWHLILLYPAMKGRTDFIRWHGRQALLLAGARTALVALLLAGAVTALVVLTLDYPAFEDVAWPTTIISYLLLFLLWLAGNLWGQGQAERGDCALMRWTGHGAGLPIPVDQKAPSAQSAPLHAQSQVDADLADQPTRMNTKPKYPRSLNLAAGVIGGIVGAISTPLMAGYITTRNETQDYNVDAQLGILLCITGAFFLGAVSGAILGIISGRRGYAIKPSAWASIGGAVIGGVVPALAVLMLLLALQILVRFAS
jgi:hypothetical protein